MAPIVEEESVVEFNEIDWSRQDEEDRQAIASLVKGSAEAGGGGPSFREPGDDEDAFMDVSDIDDDELPDEEVSFGGPNPGLTPDHGTSNDTADDDLFGEGGDDDMADLFGENIEEEAQQPEQEPEPEDLFMLNFGYHSTSNQDLSITAPPQTQEELRKLVWPDLEKGITLNYNAYFPPPKGFFQPKVAAKPPKILQPTKVSLDIAPDTEKLFRTPGPAQSDKQKRLQEASAKGLIAIIEESDEEPSDAEDFDFSTPPPDEKIGHLTWAKIETLCADIDPFDIFEEQPEIIQADEDMTDWDREILGHSATHVKTSHQEPDFFSAKQFTAPSFDNYLQDTARLGKRVILDESDPYLLLEKVEPEAQQAAKRLRTASGYAKRGGGLNALLKARFNYSNDDAYDALKENHAHKVRATLGNETVEHSMPALRLQWPYYRRELPVNSARTYHRPSANFREFKNKNIPFSLNGIRKKKNTSTLPVHEAFKDCKDLTLSEQNSVATLFEYSEEHPTVLSNFGMGNRILNYYRRKDAQDSYRPAPEDKLGEARVLLPEDKSPFTKFGMVDPGETVRSIHNQMYRAPIFEQPVKPTDFLMVRSESAAERTTWHMRNIDNLFVVGQSLPLMDIPGPSSRKHTNLSKNRLKMIGYRLMKRTPNHAVGTNAINNHFPGKAEQANRSKLRECFSYNKVDKVWSPPAGKEIPDEATIRSWIKPEDVCVIDAMQVGCRHLIDTGHAVPGLENKDKDGMNDDRLDKVKYDDKDLEEKLAPWVATRAFMDAADGKAMLFLSGEGDPTGPAQMGLSLIKTSMKGGYKGGPSSTSDRAMSLADKKATRGHSYNVKHQEVTYTNDIRRIWDKQKASLSNVRDPAEDSMDDDDDDEIDINHDTASQDGNDTDDGDANQYMVITREYKSGMGGHIDEVKQIIKDPRVYKLYMKRKARERFKGDPFDLQPTGNEVLDEMKKKAAQKELARLERNKERRLGRERLKQNLKDNDMTKTSTVNSNATPVATASGGFGSPAPMGSDTRAPTPSVEKHTGTTRKCANCGQMGHIKTNKKLCPMLNGTQGPVDGGSSMGGFGSITAPTFT